MTPTQLGLKVFHTQQDLNHWERTGCAIQRISSAEATNLTLKRKLTHASMQTPCASCSIILLAILHHRHVVRSRPASAFPACAWLSRERNMRPQCFPSSHGKTSRFALRSEPGGSQETGEAVIHGCFFRDTSCRHSSGSGGVQAPCCWVLGEHNKKIRVCLPISNTCPPAFTVDHYWCWDSVF